MKYKINKNVICKKEKIKDGTILTIDDESLFLDYETEEVFDLVRLASTSDELRKILLQRKIAVDYLNELEDFLYSLSIYGFIFIEEKADIEQSIKFVWDENYFESFKFITSENVKIINGINSYSVTSVLDMRSNTVDGKLGWFIMSQNSETKMVLQLKEHLFSKNTFFQIDAIYYIENSINDIDLMLNEIRNRMKNKSKVIILIDINKLDYLNIMKMFFDEEARISKCYENRDVLLFSKNW